MSPLALLGPPTLHKPPSTPRPKPTVDGNPIPTAFTENGSATFESTSNPCLDFFFHVVPDTPSKSIKRCLQLAWNHDPLTTLKLICNLRGVRGTGKSDKEGFYAAALWLHRLHPKTLAVNIGSIAGFGYFKDLPEMLYRLLEGSDVREKQKSEWLSRKFGSGIKKGKNVKRIPMTSSKISKKQRPKKLSVSKEVRILNGLERKK